MAMGFLSSKSGGESDREARSESEAPPAQKDDFYADLIARRPGLLDEKLKLHERIIDEFNLTALERMLPEELAKQVRTWMSPNMFDARVCPSIKRSSRFSQP